MILMSSDLALSAVQLVAYYRARFQIEFNVRDAKQQFGLEDFMNIAPTAVNNAANLAMCMANVSAKLIADSGGMIQGYVISKLPCVVVNMLRWSLNYFRSHHTMNEKRRLIGRFWHLGVSMRHHRPNELPRLA